MKKIILLILGVIPLLLQAQSFAEFPGLTFSGVPKCLLEYGTNKFFIGGSFPGNIRLYNITTNQFENAGTLPSPPHGLSFSNGRVRALGNFGINHMGAYSFYPASFQGPAEWREDNYTQLSGEDVSSYYLTDIISLGETSEIAVGNVQYVQNVWAEGGAIQFFGTFPQRIFAAVRHNGSQGQIYGVAYENNIKFWGKFTTLTKGTTTTTSPGFVGDNGVDVMEPSGLPSGEYIVSAYANYQGVDYVTGAFPEGLFRKNANGQMVQVFGNFPQGKALLSACGRLYVGGTSQNSSGALVSTDGISVIDESAGLLPGESVFDMIFLPEHGVLVALVGQSNLSGEIISGRIVWKQACMGIPVLMESFTGQLKPQGVELRWRATITNEQPLFLIERSLDGNRFESIGSVTGNTYNKEYRFVDKTIPGGTLFYRLSYGQGRVSKVISVITTIQKQVKIVQDVANKSLLFQYLEPGNTMITIMDASGRVIVSKQASVTNEQVSLHQPRGVYFVRVLAKTGNYSKSFIF